MVEREIADAATAHDPGMPRNERWAFVFASKSRNDVLCGWLRSAMHPTYHRLAGGRTAQDERRHCYEFDVRRPKGLIDPVSCDMRLETLGSSSASRWNAKGFREDVLEHQRVSPRDVELIEVHVVSPNHGWAVCRAEPGSDAHVANAGFPSRQLFGPVEFRQGGLNRSGTALNICGVVRQAFWAALGQQRNVSEDDDIALRHVKVP